MSNKITQSIANASLLLRQQHSAILSTHSLSVEGFPFGSITPFLLTNHGDIVIYASDIAQHSRNMKSNPKVSLFIHDPSEHDSQANARVTVLGEASVDAVAQSDIDRYFRLFPQAKAYEQTHDFRFYLIKTVRVRYIGGFGEIYWLPEDLWRQSFVDIGEAELSAIEHMHDDHADALEAIAQAHQAAVAISVKERNALEKNGAEITAEEKAAVESTDVKGSTEENTPELLSILHNGMHLRIQDKTQFVPFVTPISAPEEMRKAVVEVTKQARMQLAS